MLSRKSFFRLLYLAVFACRVEKVSSHPWFWFAGRPHLVWPTVLQYEATVASSGFLQPQVWFNFTWGPQGMKQAKTANVNATSRKDTVVWQWSKITMQNKSFLLTSRPFVICLPYFWLLKWFCLGKNQANKINNGKLLMTTANATCESRNKQTKNLRVTWLLCATPSFPKSSLAHVQRTAS